MSYTILTWTDDCRKNGRTEGRALQPIHRDLRVERIDPRTRRGSDATSAPAKPLRAASTRSRCFHHGHVAAAESSRRSFAERR